MLLCFVCLLVALFGKPSVSIEQLNTDAPVAIDVINPGTIYFSGELSAGLWDQLHSRAESYIYIKKERGSAAANLSRLRLSLKRLSRGVCTFNVQVKLDWNARASGSL
jgi:hypothetical protein